MNTHDAPTGAPEAAHEEATAPPGHGSRRNNGHLTASDVKTYATLGYAGNVVIALVFLPLMWLPAVALFLFYRGRDQGGLLRQHLAQAASLGAVLTLYGLAARFAMAAADVDDLYTDLLPVAVALVAGYPTLRAVQAVHRLEKYTVPRPLAWLPLD